MIYKLTQNEMMNIPRDRDEYIDVEGNTIPATTEQYFWLSLQRLRDTKQVIWVEDGADIGTLAVEPHTYLDMDGVTTYHDVQSALNTASLNYIKSTDWYVVRQTETGVVTPAAVLDKRAKCRLNIVEGA